MAMTTHSIYYMFVYRSLCSFSFVLRLQFICVIFRSIARTDLDLSHITSRVVAMSYPAEGLESAYRNHVEDVKGKRRKANNIQLMKERLDKYSLSSLFSLLSLPLNVSSESWFPLQLSWMGDTLATTSSIMCLAGSTRQPSSVRVLWRVIGAAGRPPHWVPCIT